MKNQIISALLTFLLLNAPTGFTSEDKDKEKKNYHKAFVDLLMANDLADRKKSFLYIFVHPSQNVFDYTNKNDFQRSSITSTGFTDVGINDVGHVQFAWYCQTRSDLYSGAAGFTGEQEEQKDKMLKDGWGLSTLFASYNDGEIEREYWVTEDLQDLYHNEKGYYWMAIEVEANECFNSVFFLEDFAQKSTPTFSFLNDPKDFKGAVCSSLATTFIREANTEYQGLFDATKRDVRVTREVLGNQPKKELPEGVTIPHFLLNREESNVDMKELVIGDFPFNPTTNYEQVSYYDTELLGFLIKSLEKEYIGGRSKMMTRKIVDLREKRNFSRFETGYRKKKYTTTYREVSRETDQFYGNVHRAIKSFKRNNPGIKVERKTLQGQHGLILLRNK